jgi:hypothetical protein
MSAVACLEWKDGHVCKPNYLGGRDQEDHGWKLDQEDHGWKLAGGNSLGDPILKELSHTHKRASGMAGVVGPKWKRIKNKIK